MLLIMDDLRIALAQVTCRVGDLPSNLAKHRTFAAQAAEKGAEVICFPECSLTGYPDYQDVALQAHQQRLDGELGQSMAALSQETGLLVLAGMIEEGDGCVYNTQLIARSGEIVGAYRKAHISDAEGQFFAAGDELPVWEHRGTTFGMQICYDNHFPEGARVLALRGAEVLFCPYGSPGPCTPEGYEAKQARWLRYLCARAIDNSAYVCVVNQVGDAGYSKNGKPAESISSTPRDAHSGMTIYPGGSMVLNPWAEVMARARPESEDLLIVDLSAEALREKREDDLQHFLPYRRPSLYEDLTTRGKRSGSAFEK